MTVDALQTIMLHCADLSASLAFYSEALGLPLVQADAKMAVFRAGLVQLVLDPEQNGAGPGTTLVFKMSSPGNVLNRLKRHGVSATELGDERTGRVFRVRDPDGRDLYLVERAL